MKIQKLRCDNDDSADDDDDDDDDMIMMVVVSTCLICYIVLYCVVLTHKSMPFYMVPHNDNTDTI